MLSTNALEQKRLGRKVKKLDNDVWKFKSIEVVMKGNMLKVSDLMNREDLYVFLFVYILQERISIYDTENASVIVFIFGSLNRTSI
jgi:hypothetical protein